MPGHSSSRRRWPLRPPRRRAGRQSARHPTFLWCPSCSYVLDEVQRLESRGLQPRFGEDREDNSVPRWSSSRFAPIRSCRCSSCRLGAWTDGRQRWLN
jgi:hypothetical protein